MLENEEMEESRSGTVKIADMRYDALQAFVNYLYTAETCLNQNWACDLLILAEKYQVQHLKNYCQKFLVSKLNWDNALTTYAFAHRHNAEDIMDAALEVITENMESSLPSWSTSIWWRMIPNSSSKSTKLISPNRFILQHIVILLTGMLIILHQTTEMPD
ncbi:hypothetical protein ACFX1X_017521 [Malus domestica]